jgi:hypothetical protein
MERSRVSQLSLSLMLVVALAQQTLSQDRQTGITIGSNLPNQTTTCQEGSNLEI